MFLPIRALGNVLSAAMAVIVVAIATGLVVDAARLGSAHWRWAFIDLRLDVGIDIAMFVYGVLFIVWFHRARINSEQSDWRQRRARAWTFWGWVVPIANLFVPFQLMGDIWRAGLPPEQRNRTAGLPVLWWITFLLSNTHIGVSHSYHYGWWSVVEGSWPSQILLIVSGLTLASIIRIVSTGLVGHPPLPFRDATYPDPVMPSYDV